ncbi:hypothetical protein [Xanthovirga aplysinae]|uniref:hypothetical protein n=1 Tax=Xanthovirga aplysinae TaxID=2529853 RepID=UPI0012BB6B46|nr:hypothetical protein [Xanthovirga aplysinae]MTI29383.1 hypothetical protein [Xanthovirga aplysinae]
MRSIILAFLLIGLSLNSFGQFAFNNISFELKKPPNNPYRIIQTRDGETTKVEEFDETGRQVFQYIQGDIPPFFNWTEPHRFIYAFEYDESGKTVKRYAFNSNAGHNIYEYEYSDDSSTKHSYQRSYPDEGKQNTNAYADIERLRTFSDLMNSSEVAVMNSSDRIFLNREHLDQNRNPIKYVEYSKMHKDTLSTTTKYDVELREIKKTVVNSKGEINRENVYEYLDSKSQISTINHYRNGQIAFFYRFAETKNEAGETEYSYSERKGTLNVRHNQYEEGYLTSITVYKTKFKGELIVPVSKKFKKVAEMKYTYNELGLMEKEEMNNYETGEKETRTYKYQIENL